MKLLKAILAVVLLTPKFLSEVKETVKLFVSRYRQFKNHMKELKKIMPKGTEKRYFRAIKGLAKHFDKKTQVEFLEQVVKLKKQGASLHYAGQQAYHEFMKRKVGK